MAEWLKAPDSKSDVLLCGTAGSNPAPSARFPSTGVGDVRFVKRSISISISIYIYIYILLGALILCLASFWVLQTSAKQAIENPSSGPTCVSNLVLIQAAKHRWAFDNGATSQTIPPESILSMESTPRYVESTLVCPQGGTYHLGSVIELPTCSIGGADHQL